MTDEPVNPQPAPPAAEEMEKLKKKHDEMGFKLRTSEADRISAQEKVKELEGKVSESAKASIDLLRTRLAYEAGIPHHLFGLVTGNNEAEIKAQIEIIRGEFKAPESQPGEPAPPAQTTATVIPPKPQPAGTSDEGWVAKFEKATPEQQQTMLQDVRDGKVNPGFG